MYVCIAASHSHITPSQKMPLELVGLSSSQAVTLRCLSSNHSFPVMGYSGLEPCRCSILWSDNVLEEWPHVKHHELVVISPIALVCS